MTEKTLLEGEWVGIQKRQVLLTFCLFVSSQKSQSDREPLIFALVEDLFLLDQKLLFKKPL